MTRLFEIWREDLKPELVIHKYWLEIQNGTRQTLELPDGAYVLHVDYPQNDPGNPSNPVNPHSKIALWAAVDPTVPTEPRTFIVIGTGKRFEFEQPGFDMFHVGTVLIKGGWIVWHVFEEMDTQFVAPEEGDE